MSDDGTPLHLVPIERDIVYSLCDRAMLLTGGEMGIALEAQGFRDSRTPWDARRLANGIAWSARSINNADLWTLADELFKLAEQRAGLKPDPRLARPPVVETGQ